MSENECTPPAAVDEVIPFGHPIGRRDDNGRMIANGDLVQVLKHAVSAVSDGWGQGNFGTHKWRDTYTGRVYYDPDRCEFRIDDQRLGDGKRSRNVYEFDSIIVIS